MASGMPCASVSRLRLTSPLPRSVGLGPVFFLAQRGFCHGAIQCQPRPVNPVQCLQGYQSQAPEVLEYACLRSFLKPPVGSYPAEFAQVCNLAALPPGDLDAVLAATDVGEVWGVGRRIFTQLREGGITSVLDPAQMDPAQMDPACARRRWSVVLELQGLACIGLDDQAAPKQEIACTRSFGRPVTELGPLVKAVSEFATRAAEKLRGQGSVTTELLVFAHTSPFWSGPRFARSVVVPLRRPTSDTERLVQTAVAGIRSIYQPGHDLIKAGVMLLDLVSRSVYQGEFALEPDGDQEREPLMTAMDAINHRCGAGTLHLASSGINDPSVPVWHAPRAARAGLHHRLDRHADCQGGLIRCFHPSDNGFYRWLIR